MQKLLVAIILGVFLLTPATIEAKKARPAKALVAKKVPIKKIPPTATRPIPPQQATTSKVVCLRNPAVPQGQLDITERVCEAKKILASGTTEYGICEKKERACKGKGKNKTCVEKTRKGFCAKTILIASLEPKTRKISVVKVDAERGISKTPGYSVTRIVNDGVDSEYNVRVPPGQLVVGLQLPVQIKTARGIIVERAIYTPYTRELREAYPELVTLGWNYLQEGISAARQRITASGVKLDDIDPRLIFSLVLVEHFTNQELSDAEVEEEMYRVALTLGTNGKAAYKYSVSKKGARCLGQFMETTWNRLRSRFPKHVSAEFFQGSADHSQAFAAQWLLAKEDLSYLFSKKRWRGNSPQKLLLLSNPRTTGEYLALSYNGGAPRAHRWLASARQTELPDEGQKYIRKFHQVWNVLERLAVK